METEIWKDVIGFEGLYQVSSYGRVKSLDRIITNKIGFKRKLKGKIIKPINNNRYYLCCLTKQKTASIHRVVASAFIPNPHNKPCVNHIDGNGKNNHISNLEWCTYSENEKHSYSVLGKKPIKSNLGNTGIKAKDSKPVARYSLNGELLAVYGSASEAARYLGKNQGRISCNARGETLICYGSKFKYISKNKYFKMLNTFQQRLKLSLERKE